MREVLETLVEFGAPERILTDGSPHLGTDNLVRLLKRSLHYYCTNRLIDDYTTKLPPYEYTTLLPEA